jgi:hypothetical protein
MSSIILISPLDKAHVVVPTLDPTDHVDVTGIPVAQTQNSVDPDNVDTSNDEGVRKNSEI